MERLPVNVHAGRDNGLHGITSSDCGRLAGVDVFLPSPKTPPVGELAETKPTLETTLSQKPKSVSPALAETGRNTDVTSGVMTNDGTAADLSNSGEDPIETAERKCPELVSVAATKVGTHSEMGSCTGPPNNTGVDKPGEELAVDVKLEDFSSESAECLPVNCIPDGETSTDSFEPRDEFGKRP